MQRGLTQGGTALAALGSLYAGLALAGLPPGQTRAAVFAALVGTVAALVLANRAFSVPLLTALRRPNAALWGLLAATAGLLGVALSTPTLRSLFGFAPPPTWAIVCAFATSLGLLPVLGVLARRTAPRSCLPYAG